MIYIAILWQIQQPQQCSEMLHGQRSQSFMHSQPYCEYTLTDTETQSPLLVSIDYECLDSNLEYISVSGTTV